MEAESRLNGLPRISNRASAVEGYELASKLLIRTAQIVPAEGLPLDARGSRLCCGSVDEGTELIWTNRRFLMLRTAFVGLSCRTGLMAISC